MPLEVHFEQLASQDRSAFSCGVPELDAWFVRQAGQEQRRNIARVFVAVEREMGVVGFYSLSTYAVERVDLPGAVVRKLPRYDSIPAVLIGRLARDLRVRGTEVGTLLLADAVRRSLALSESVAVFAVVVDSKNEQAALFYEGFGFLRFPDRPQRLFLPLLTAARALA